jgi:hypothetical protein
MFLPPNKYKMPGLFMNYLVFIGLDCDCPSWMGEGVSGRGGEKGGGGGGSGGGARRQVWWPFSNCVPTFWKLWELLGVSNVSIQDDMHLGTAGGFGFKMVAGYTLYYSKEDKHGFWSEWAKMKGQLMFHDVFFNTVSGRQEMTVGGHFWTAPQGWYTHADEISDVFRDVAVFFLCCSKFRWATGFHNPR